MINDESRRKLREMNLGEIISGLEAQQAEPATLGLPFDDRMQRLVDYVYQEKYNAKIQRLIRSARLRFPQADMQGILYEGRGLNRELLGNLSRHPPEHRPAGIYRIRQDIPGLCPGETCMPQPVQGSLYPPSRPAYGIW